MIELAWKRVKLFMSHSNSTCKIYGILEFDSKLIESSLRLSSLLSRIRVL